MNARTHFELLIKFLGVGIIRYIKSTKDTCGEGQNE